MKLVTRSQWGARPPDFRAGFTPRGVTIHWEGPHMGTFSHSSCATKVRGIQAFHMDERGWSDIAYSAIVCPHGYIFEGRGRGIRTAANGTNEGNDRAHAVCYLGGEGDPFTQEGKVGIVQAIVWLGNGFVNCHRDWKPTACPGDVICTWVKSGIQVTDSGDTDKSEEEPQINLGEPMDCFIAADGSVNESDTKFTQFWILGSKVMYMDIHKDTATKLAKSFMGQVGTGVPIRQASSAYINNLKAAEGSVKLGK